MSTNPTPKRATKSSNQPTPAVILPFKLSKNPKNLPSPLPSSLPKAPSSPTPSLAKITWDAATDHKLFLLTFSRPITPAGYARLSTVSPESTVGSIRNRVSALRAEARKMCKGLGYDVGNAGGGSVAVKKVVATPNKKKGRIFGEKGVEGENKTEGIEEGRDALSKKVTAIEKKGGSGVKRGVGYVEENEYLMFLKNEEVVKSEEGVEVIGTLAKKARVAMPEAQARKASGGGVDAVISRAFSSMEEQVDPFSSQVIKIVRKSRLHAVVGDHEIEV
ncbi:hypothetical protein G6011_08086 [Alternaria panax]|uniref:Uncharacterized protein n=1 Tax=Alternaria panax TaxID=48097 RepID=A0AAD4FH97_9PLEO|nr:hypothetical protein G6011_08086 [Alternaria panax]